MKVKEFMRKVNAITLKVPVYLKNAETFECREAESWDFGDYYYDEKDRTVKSIDIQPTGITVYYK